MRPRLTVNTFEFEIHIISWDDEFKNVESNKSHEKVSTMMVGNSFVPKTVVKSVLVYKTGRCWHTGKYVLRPLPRFKKYELKFKSIHSVAW